MLTVGIDPGTEESAIVMVDGNKRPQFSAILKNQDMVEKMYLLKTHGHEHYEVSIEMVACYGMPVGAEVFETCVWIGRFREAWGASVRFIYRQQVKLHFCHSNRAKDPHIRQALIDRYGAPGTKAAPGALYGIKSHMWPALAVAVYAADTEQ